MAESSSTGTMFSFSQGGEVARSPNPFLSCNFSRNGKHHIMQLFLEYSRIIGVRRVVKRTNATSGIIQK